MKFSGFWKKIFCFSVVVKRSAHWPINKTATKMWLGSFFRGASGHKRFYKRQTNVERLTTLPAPTSYIQALIAAVYSAKFVQQLLFVMGHSEDNYCATVCMSQFYTTWTWTWTWAFKFITITRITWLGITLFAFWRRTWWTPEKLRMTHRSL